MKTKRASAPQGGRDISAPRHHAAPAVALSLLVAFTAFSCSLFYGPTVAVDESERAALATVFPSDVVDYVCSNIYEKDDLEPISCYYTVLRVVFVRPDAREQVRVDNALVHEAAHYWQDAKLHRDFEAEYAAADYVIPDDISKQLNIEAEAEIVRFVALYRINGKAPPEKYVAYMKTFMGL